MLLELVGNFAEEAPELLERIARHGRLFTLLTTTLLAAAKAPKLLTSETTLTFTTVGITLLTSGANDGISAARSFGSG